MKKTIILALVVGTLSAGIPAHSRLAKPTVGAYWGDGYWWNDLTRPGSVIKCEGGARQDDNGKECTSESRHCSCVCKKGTLELVEASPADPEEDGPMWYHFRCKE